MRASKNAVAVAAAVGFLLIGLGLAGCSDDGPCAYGPTEIRDVALASHAGETLDLEIVFPEGSAGVFKSLSTEQMPSGVALTLSDTGVHIGGSVAEAGAYSFQILAQEEAGNACARWARYDVALSVE